MSNKRSILKRGRQWGWNSGYVKPKGKFEKRWHNKKIRHYKGKLMNGGFWKKVSPMEIEWC